MSKMRLKIEVIHTGEILWRNIFPNTAIIILIVVIFSSRAIIF